MPSGVTTVMSALRRWSTDHLKSFDSEAALPAGGAAFFGWREEGEGPDSRERLMREAVGCGIIPGGGIRGWRGRGLLLDGCAGIGRDAGFCLAERRVSHWLKQIPILP